MRKPDAFIPLGQDSVDISGSPATANLLQQGGQAYNVLVSFIVLRVIVTLSGGAPSGDLTDTLKSGQIDWQWKNIGNPWLNNLRMSSVDLWAKSRRLPSAHDYDVLAGQTVSGTGTFYVDFRLPVERPNCRYDETFLTPLSEFGEAQVTLPDLSGLSATTATAVVRAYAVGYRCPPGSFRIAPLVRVDELSPGSGNTIQYPLGKRRLIDLWHYSIDPASSPISEDTNPRLQLDNEQVTYLQNGNAAETPYLYSHLESADDYSDFVTVSGYDNTLRGILYPQGQKWSISDKPRVGLATIDFSARLTTPSDERIVSETVYPASPGSMVNRLPPGSVNDQGEMDAVVQSVAPGAPAELRAFLPATVAGF